MICYLDTSALVKLYVEEEGSDLVMRYVREAGLVATSKVAYAETRAALARSKREGLLGNSTYREAVANFEEDCPSLFVLELTDAVVFKAGELVERFPLRGFDSIHLASVVTLVDALARAPKPEQVTVGCWDRLISEAMRSLGLTVFP